MINFLGAKPVPIPLVEDRGFSFDLNVLKDSLSPKTKMLILNSPHNPTGGVIPAEDVRAIADMVRDRDLVVLSDEIYTRIYFDQEAPLSISTLPGMLEKTMYSGRLLEDLRDDGLAHGLRRDAGVAGGSGEQADGEFELVHRQLHAARRDRRAQRAAGRRHENGGRVSPPARCFLRGTEHAAGIPLRHSGRRVLRVPEHSGDRDGNRRNWPTRCCRRRAWRV